jgi:hypothetical protein
VSLFDEEKIISELKGNTLRAYWALMNSDINDVDGDYFDSTFVFDPGS